MRDGGRRGGGGGGGEGVMRPFVVTHVYIILYMYIAVDNYCSNVVSILSTDMLPLQL